MGSLAAPQSKLRQQNSPGRVWLACSVTLFCWLVIQHSGVPKHSQHNVLHFYLHGWPHLQRRRRQCLLSVFPECYLPVLTTLGCNDCTQGLCVSRACPCGHQLQRAAPAWERRKPHQQQWAVDSCRAGVICCARPAAAAAAAAAATAGAAHAATAAAAAAGCCCRQ